MKRGYNFYILVLISIFVSAIFIWPSYQINIDIGDFHYHKLWKGPNLSDLTFGKLNYDFDLPWGMDFIGGVAYRFKVQTDPSVSHEQRQESVKETIGLLRKRLEAIGYVESTVDYQDLEGNTYIDVKVEGPSESFEDYKDIIFQRGMLEIWSEKELEAQEIPIEGEIQTTDPLKSFLEQNYSKVHIQANRVKGIRTGSDKETYFIKVMLENSEVKGITEQSQNFWGKSLIAVLDKQFLTVDGRDLGEQIQYYREIRGIKLLGFVSDKQAQVSKCIIEAGPLPIELEIIETKDFAETYEQGVLAKGTLSGLVVIAIIIILLIAAFKQYGIAGAFALMFYGLFVLSLLKIVPVKLTIGVIAATVSSTGIFLSFLIFSIRDKFQQSQNVSRMARNSKSLQIINDTVTLQSMFAVSLLVLAPSVVQYFAWIILTSAGVAWFILNYLLPSLYRVAFLVRNKK